MPLSTGLLTDYFPPEKQASLLGISSAMNQLGASLPPCWQGCWRGSAGGPAFWSISWGWGAFSCVCASSPKGRIPRQAPTAQAADTPRPGGLRTFFVYVLAMFLLMSTFFLYPPTLPWRPVGTGSSANSTSPPSWPGPT